ncbi:TetR/AcrR family transcriptional regulator [Prolixibacteraceae bacterium JC049]|nr:TetR/AcrR family transcriptional regulator [Prolixibacteraceae bacterium JC049]
MQVQKDNIRKRILEVAGEEFLAKGFKAVSMRDLAKKTGVGLSNIYNYFQNKNEILKEVLQPLFSEFDRIMEEHNSVEFIDINIFTSSEYLYTHTQTYLNLIINYREELKLLLFHASGSQYENFREEFCNRHTVIGMEYMRSMKAKYPHINIEVSDFFIHTMSGWWMTILGEVVSHDLSPNEIEEFLSDYIAFGTAGWKQLMKV